MLNIRKENILENYFKSYLEEDYDIDIFQYLLEILNKNEPIKLDSDYLNDVYKDKNIPEDDVWKYKGDPVFAELKQDMSDWIESIADEVEKIPGVESVKIKGSDQAGMSTYLTVHFTQPTENDPVARRKMRDDKKFLTHYRSGFGADGGYDGEYRLKFRISNHGEKHISDTNVFVNILGHNYNWIRDNIINLCKKQATAVQNYYKDYCQTGKISPKQIKRNQKRKDNEFLRVEYLKNGYISDRHIKLLKETFGGDRIQTLLDKSTLQCLHTANVNIEDIVSGVETHFQSSSIDYITLLFILANCLDKFVLDYTFDNDFDYGQLYDDMEPIVNKYQIN